MTRQLSNNSCALDRCREREDVGGGGGGMLDSAMFSALAGTLKSVFRSWRKNERKNIAKRGIAQTGGLGFYLGSERYSNLGNPICKAY